jgi:origin recognition complex subunit 1
VVAQLQLRRDDGELSDFNFVEINGMKLTNPHTAYEMLWEAISGDRVSAASATILLEQAFKTKSDTRMPTVVLMDELDQLVTRNQVVMYNFFNWPTLVHSRLIVIAVANTMDLPERTLSNKISSRLGLMRIQFPGYSYQQLVEIITSRLAQATDVFDHDAIEFAARKIAGVSGDARRALEICRRAVELAEPDGNTVTLRHIKEAISESTSSPLAKFLQTLAMAGKVLLCAILARVRRSGVIENPLADILIETERLVNLTEKAPQTQALLWPDGRVRMAGFLNALSELGEGGVIVQQAMRGESTASVRLIVPEDIVKTALKDDQDVADIL